MSRTGFRMSLGAIAVAVTICAAAPSNAAPKSAAPSGAHLISHSREAVPFVADDYAHALAVARAKHVPIFVEAWAPW
jgi:hypothetical protein